MIGPGFAAAAAAKEFAVIILIISAAILPIIFAVGGAFVGILWWLS